ncbi:MAG: hypothetical protein K8I00_10550 [Candidatus Omnitrophica bacterium]|nr:hypothetical protein [Candidatus Omnitrophota bacterium]
MSTELLIQIKKLVIVVVVFQLAIFLAILVYKLVRRLRENKIQKELLQRIAAQHGGSYDPGTNRRPPKSVISHQGHDVEVYYRARTRYKNGCTIGECGVFGTKDFEFCIYVKTLLSDVAKLVGMQDVVIGQPVFDQKFIIKTNSPLLIKEFLSPDVCKQILSLPKPHMAIKLNKGRLVLSVEEMFKDIRDYDQLIGLTQKLAEELDRKA